MGVLNPQTFDFLDGLDIDGSFSWLEHTQKVGCVKPMETPLKTHTYLHSQNSDESRQNKTNTKFPTQ